MWRVCASLQKREASAAERQRSEACGIQEPHATLSVLHVSVKPYVATRISGSVLAPLHAVVGASWQNCFFDAHKV